MLLIAVATTGCQFGSNCDEPLGRAITAQVVLAPDPCSVDVPASDLAVGFTDDGISCPSGCTCAPRCTPSGAPIRGSFTIDCKLETGRLTIDCEWSIDQWESGDRETLGCDATVFDFTGAEVCFGNGSQMCDTGVSNPCPGF